MKTKTIELRKDHLAALLLAAGDKDIRYYLNGVCLDLLPAFSRLVATNGHVLAVTHVPETLIMPEGEPTQYIIPRDVLKHFKPTKFGVPHVTLTIKDATHGVLFDKGNGLSVEFEFIQGKFPDYLKVITKGAPSGVQGQFQPAYYELWRKVGKILSPRGEYYVHHNGPDQAAMITTTDPGFLGVMMPWRGEGSFERPVWL